MCRVMFASAGAFVEGIDLKRRMGETGLHKTRQCFDSAVVTVQMAHVYQSTL